MASHSKTASKALTETTEQLTEEVESEELSVEQSVPLSPKERADKAYILVYGEDAELPFEHKSIKTAQSADWFVRSYMGGIFTTPNDHPLTQKFSYLEELMTWFDQTYPVQVDETVESVKTENAT